MRQEKSKLIELVKPEKFLHSTGAGTAGCGRCTKTAAASLGLVCGRGAGVRMMSICYLYECSQKKDHLPDWLFGYQEHKKFLEQIANECGIDAAWNRYLDKAEHVMVTISREARKFRPANCKQIGKQARKTKQSMFCAEDC